MQKVMHTYGNVRIPMEAKEIVDTIYEEVRAKGVNIRKADIWLSAANLAFEKHVELEMKNDS